MLQQHHHRWGARHPMLGTLVALVLALATACGKDGGGADAAAPADAPSLLDADPGGDAPDADPSQDAPPAPLTRAQVVSAIATCSLELYRSFVPVADALAAANTALAADGSAERWDAARQAWNQAMDVWQQVEVHQYGPLASPANSTGGKDIRDSVYSWPPLARCAVEQTLVRGRYKEPDFIARSFIQERGLAALEYLLFYAGTDNACAPTVSINADGSWAALAAAPEMLAQRKREYAAVIAADVAVRATALVDAWDPQKGNFLAELTSAGGGRLLTSAQAALNLQGHALFYLEKPAKDVKVGLPLGRQPECMGICPDALESRFAKRSKSHLRQNLNGFARLALGCPASGDVGFDDLLVALGRADVAEKLRSSLAGVAPTLEAIPGEDLADALVNNPAAVEAVYNALRAVVAVLKVDLTGALNISLPPSVAGDNDV